MLVVITCIPFFDSCDGEYTLKVWNPDPPHDYPAYARISGLEDYKIAYTSQAAEIERYIGVHIYKKRRDGTRSRIYCKAHILQLNYLHMGQNLYIAFDRRCIHYYYEYFHQDMLRDGSIRVIVEFQLKSSYFRNLCKSVGDLPSDVIRRIRPCDCHISSIKAAADELTHEYNGALDSEQQKALRAILHEYPPNSPPILITGPFGTGKTRIIAMAAHVLFKKRETRILVCTQQRESADNFMSMYRDVVSTSGSDDHNVTNIILRDYGSQRKKFYVNPQELPDCLKNSELNLLIVTTCLTAHYLTSASIEFTHIFVDEGAQMREPEAIAPLNMAKKHAKVVIVGDPQQVCNSMCMTILVDFVHCQ